MSYGRGVQLAIGVERPEERRTPLVAADLAALATAGHLVEAPSSRTDLLLGIGPATSDDLRLLRPGAATLSLISADLGTQALRRERGILGWSLDRIPRSTAAQSMDALTSQSMIIGYRGAMVGLGRLRRFVPLAMTAAGTVGPATVVVLGAGVAGLQAMSTCVRAGARVLAYDVRASAASEIGSVGATYLELDLPPLEGAAGYARTLDADRSLLQQERLLPYVAAADLVITTAMVPEHPAPLLVSEAMWRSMRPGSVVVDLAAEAGGNVAGTRLGASMVVDGITLWAEFDVASQLAESASQLLSNNIRAVIEHLARCRAAGTVDSDPILAAMRR